MTDITPSSSHDCLITLNEKSQYILSSADRRFLALCGLSDKSIGCDIKNFFPKDFIDHLNLIYRTYLRNKTYSHYKGEHYTVSIPCADGNFTDIIIDIQSTNSFPEFKCTLSSKNGNQDLVPYHDFNCCRIDNQQIAYVSPYLAAFLDNRNISVIELLRKLTEITSSRSEQTISGLTIINNTVNARYTISLHIIFSSISRNSYLAFITEPNENEKLCSLNTLSPREYETLRLASQGFTNKEIADRLFVSQSCINKFLSSAYHKINISSRTELAPLL